MRVPGVNQVVRYARVKSLAIRKELDAINRPTAYAEQPLRPNAKFPSVSAQR